MFCFLTVKSTKYFWLFSPTQLFTQGQWWSIFLMQRLHTLRTHTWDGGETYRQEKTLRQQSSQGDTQMGDTGADGSPSWCLFVCWLCECVCDTQNWVPLCHQVSDFQAATLCVIYHSKCILQHLIWATHKSDSSHTAGKKTFIQADTNFSLWDEWLTSFTIQLLCSEVCAFHASGSQWNPWAASQGSPDYQAAEPVRKHFTGSLTTHTGEVGGQKQTQRRRGRSQQLPPQTSPEHCGMECRTCSGELCQAWCCSTWDTCTPPVLVWAAGSRWILS